MAGKMVTKIAALAALALPRLVSGAQGDICYIENPQAVMIRDQVFLTGANYSRVASNALGDETDIGTSASILSLNLNGQLPVENRIPARLPGTIPIAEEDSVAYANAVKSRGALWHTDDTIYSIGEDYGVATNKLTAFDIRTSTFKEVTASGGNFNFGPRSGAQFVSVPEQKLAFLAGGFYFDKPGWSTGGLLRFDASDPDQLSWTNETLGDGSFGAEVPNLQMAAMVYLPAGKKGVLVTFGGGDVSAGVSPNSGWPDDVAFTTVWVYDIASHTWWQQRASGAAPRTRTKFCAAVAAAPDGGAFHITTYGGWSLLDQRSYEDVYVLSLPSFRWINATALAAKSNAERDVDATTGREAASCHAYRGGQMVVLGGTVRQTLGGRPVVQSGKCNGAFSPVRALDLSTYSWLAALNTTANYSVPPIIYNEIGGDASGGATVTEPENGFANVGLSSVLAERVPTATATSHTDAELGDGNPNDNASRTPIGAIVGGVVGGVAVLVLVAAWAWWLLRKRRQAAAANSTSPESHAADSYSYGGVPKASDAPSELHGSSGPSQLASAEVYQLPADRQVHQLPSENRAYYEMPAR